MSHHEGGDMRRWDSLIDRYTEEQKQRGLTEEYVLGTRRELERLGAWLKRRRPKPKLEQIDLQVLIKYIRDRTQFKAKATVSGIVSKLKCIGNFLVREQVWRSNQMNHIKGPRINQRDRIPRRISKADLEKLFLAVMHHPIEYFRYAWLAVTALLYSTGMRRGELERLKLSSLDCSDNTIKIDGRKTGRERIVLVPEGVAAIMEAYLVRRHNHLEKLGCLSEDSLFVNRNGAPMKGNAISGSLLRIAKKIDVPLYRLHQFRHTCASHLLVSGISIVKVQKILGHASIQNTMLYIDITDPERKQAMELHPINEMLRKES